MATFRWATPLSLFTFFVTFLGFFALLFPLRKTTAEGWRLLWAYFWSWFTELVVKLLPLAFIYPRFPSWSKAWNHIGALLALVFQARMLWRYDFFRGPRGLAVLVDDWNFMMQQTGKGIAVFFFDAVLGTAVALVFFLIEARRWRLSTARTGFFVLTTLLIGTDFSLPLFLLQLTKLEHEASAKPSQASERKACSGRGLVRWLYVALFILGVGFRWLPDIWDWAQFTHGKADGHLTEASKTIIGERSMLQVMIMPVGVGWFFEPFIVALNKDGTVDSSWSGYAKSSIVRLIYIILLCWNQGYGLALGLFFREFLPGRSCIGGAAVATPSLSDASAAAGATKKQR